MIINNAFPWSKGLYTEHMEASPSCVGKSIPGPTKISIFICYSNVICKGVIILMVREHLSTVYVLSIKCVVGC